MHPAARGRRSARLCGQELCGRSRSSAFLQGQLLHSLSGCDEAFDPAACLNTRVCVLLSIYKKQAYIISVNGFNFRLKVTAKQGRIKEPSPGESILSCLQMTQHTSGCLCMNNTKWNTLLWHPALAVQWSKSIGNSVSHFYMQVFKALLSFT